MDEAINEMGTVAAPSVEDTGEQRRTAEQEVSKEIRGVSEYLLDVHGLPLGWKGEGVIRVIYKNLNGLQSALSKNEKLDKAVVSMEITFMDNGGHIFVLDEFIEQMNSHI